jgi:hypothetical protein
MKCVVKCVRILYTHDLCVWFRREMMTLCSFYKQNAELMYEVCVCVCAHDLHVWFRCEMMALCSFYMQNSELMNH